MMTEPVFIDPAKIPQIVDQIFKGVIPKKPTAD